MLTAGPALPPHLAAQQQNAKSTSAPRSTSAPSPTLFRVTSSPTAPKPAAANDSDSEDDFGPALPPELVEARQQTSSTTFNKPKLLGPSLPPEYQLANKAQPAATAADYPPEANSYNFSTRDEDDSFGPMPLPAQFQAEENEGARLFREREERDAEREREAQQKAGKPQREEWMLVPPKEMDLLSSMDPTKLKSRSFQSGPKLNSSRAENSSAPNLWTETPAERQQRISDEMMGKKRKAEISNGAGAAGEQDSDELRRKRARDAQLREEVERHNKSSRSASLLDQHAKTSRTKSGEIVDKEGKMIPGIWDRERDMSVGGRLLDDNKRTDLIKNAKDLGGRFGGGSFL